MLSLLHQDKYKYIAERIDRMGMTRTEKSHSENHLKCGMLVKNLQDYEYFSGYLDNSRLVMHSCNDVRMNTPDDGSDEGSNYLTADSELFKKVITYILIIVAVILVIGFLIELVRYYRRRKIDESSPQGSTA